MIFCLPVHVAWNSGNQNGGPWLVEISIALGSGTHYIPNIAKVDDLVVASDQDESM
jgi:hypothetical protein